MDAQLQKRAENGMTFQDMRSMAETLLKSGFLPNAIRTPEQALTVMICGKELGLGFMESLRSINVIQGKPCMSAQLLLGLCYKTKEVEKAYIEQSTTERCVFVLQRKGHPPYSSVFTIEDAQAMGLTNKDNWKKQTATMLKWRAIAAACRVVFPDSISGVYTPEEIAPDAVVLGRDEQGEVEVVEVKQIEEDKKPVYTKDSPSIDVDGMDETQLLSWQMPYGKFKGLSLSQIYNQSTENGKQVGLEYLLWCSENLKTASHTEIIKKFLDMMSKSQIIDTEE